MSVKSRMVSVQQRWRLPKVVWEQRDCSRLANDRGGGSIAHGRAFPRSRITISDGPLLGRRRVPPPLLPGIRTPVLSSMPKGSSCFANEEDHLLFLALLSSHAVDYFLELLNPTLEVQVGDVGNHCPFTVVYDKTQYVVFSGSCSRSVSESLARIGNGSETSWDFQQLSGWLEGKHVIQINGS